MGRLPRAIAFLLLPSCALDFDAVGPRGGESALTGGGDNVGAQASGGNDVGAAPAGGATSCTAETGACVELPAGFGALIDLREDQPCGGPSILDGTLSGENITAPDATCGCSCRFDPATCGAAEVWSNGNCNADGGDITLNAGVCTPVPGILTYKVQLGAENGALCESDKAEGPAPPKFTFDEPFAVCTVDDEIGCEGGACLPADGGRYCLQATTATSCPTETFTVPETFRVGADYDDTRGCACDCSGPSGAVQCGVPTVSFFTTGDCSVLVGMAAVGSGCNHTGDAAGGLILAPAIEGACLAAEEIPTGGVSERPGAGTLLCCTH